MNINDHVEAMWTFAHKSMEVHKAVQILAAFVTEDKVYFLPCDGMSKELFGMALEHCEGQIPGASGVVMVQEAWMVSQSTPPSEFDVAPSQHPDRVEIVMVSWKTAEGDQGMQIRKIVRTESDVTIGEAVNTGAAAYNVFFDRLFNKTAAHTLH